MNIQPLSTKILILPTLQESKTKSGILVPDTVDKEKPITGIVEATGIDVVSVKKGDRILFRKYAPDEYEGYLICDESDILSIINEPD